MFVQAQRGAGGISPPILTSVLDRVDRQRHAPYSITSGKIRYPLYRRRVEPPGVSGRARKISTVLGFGPRPVDVMAS